MSAFKRNAKVVFVVVLVSLVVMMGVQYSDVVFKHPQAGAIIGLIVGAALSFCAAYLYIQTKFIRPLKELHSKLAAIVEGDLSQTFYIGNLSEIGRINTKLAAIQVKLDATLSSASSGLSLIFERSNRLGIDSADIGSQAISEVAALQQTATSMQQLSRTVSQNADNAREADSLSSLASDEAQQGGQVMQDVISTMSGISTNAKKVSDIATVIDDIAYQTNILALNAAIEAAHAGDRGKGFAVVAAEVRNLALRSAEAANEVKNLIKESTLRVMAGQQLVEQAGVKMNQIVESITKVNLIVGDIASASNEQATGIVQINNAMSRLDYMMHKNKMLVNEVSTATVDLKVDANVVYVALSTLNKTKLKGLLPGTIEIEGEEPDINLNYFKKYSLADVNSSKSVVKEASAAESEKDVDTTSPEIMSPVTGKKADLPEWASF